MKKLLLYGAFLGSLIPTKDDWERKIEALREEYYLKVIFLPRKLKKKRKKELLSNMKFYERMKSYNPFNY